MKKYNLHIRKQKRVWAGLLLLVNIFMLLLCLEFLFGTTDIFAYIDANATKIEKRQLEFGIEQESGNYYVQNNDDSEPVKVLQLSDIHLGAGILSANRDRLVVDAVIKIVTNTKPDIIILTGDFVYPSPLTLTLNNFNSSRAIGKLFEKFEIPWAVVYGNHDAPFYATHSKTQLSEYFESLDFCLFQKGPENITGQGNYVVKLLSATGELESALILMDSNAYTGLFKYDIIHDNQVEWYANQIQNLKNSNGDIVPTHLYIHIPLYEYRLAWEEYINGGEDAVYHYGKKDDKRIASADDDRGRLFNRIVELGSTKNVFAGHDHTHNFSITYKGVRLTYGMSMDYTAYVYIYFTEEYRGGTLLEISTLDASYEIFPILQTNGFLPVE